MSYDIWLEMDAGGKQPVKLDSLDENYTSNLSEFFQWFLDKPLGDFNDAEAWELKEALARGFDRLAGRGNEKCPSLEFLREFEPENGWGSVLGAIGFLSRIYAAVIEAPNAKVRLWC